MLDNTPNEQSKCRTKFQVKINYDSQGTYNTNRQVNFKTTMLKSSLCDYSNACIIVKETITVVGAGANEATRDQDKNDKLVVFKICAPFNNCISEMNSTQVHNAKDPDIVMHMYNLVEYSNNFSKTFRSLYQFRRNEPKKSHNRFWII